MALRFERRVLLRLDDDRFARLFRLSETGRGELLIGFYGLRQKAAVHSYRIADRLVAEDDLQDLGRAYSEMEQVEVVADHFTFHRSGVFHFKRGREASSLYSDRLITPPIDQEACRFLDMMILADRAVAYETLVSNPRSTDIQVGTRGVSDATLADRPPGTIVAFRFRATANQHFLKTFVFH